MWALLDKLKEFILLRCAVDWRPVHLVFPLCFTSTLTSLKPLLKTNNVVSLWNVTFSHDLWWTWIWICALSPIIWLHWYDFRSVSLLLCGCAIHRRLVSFTRQGHYFREAGTREQTDIGTDIWLLGGSSRLDSSSCLTLAILQGIQLPVTSVRMFYWALCLSVWDFSVVSFSFGFLKRASTYTHQPL